MAAVWRQFFTNDLSDHVEVDAYLIAEGTFPLIEGYEPVPFSAFDHDTRRKLEGGRAFDPETYVIGFSTHTKDFRWAYDAAFNESERIYHLIRETLE